MTISEIGVSFKAVEVVKSFIIKKENKEYEWFARSEKFKKVF